MSAPKIRTFFGKRTGWELQCHRHSSAPRRRWHIVSNEGWKMPATSWEVALWRSLPNKMRERAE